MDVSPLKDWLSLFALAFSVGTPLVLYFKSDAKKAIETLAGHASRIQKLEDELQHLPRKEAVHELQLALTKMEGQIATMVKSSEATERATRRVEDFLMSKS
ncbi:DUF2730 family protein [Shinella sp.]|uniref:DUF2730 family protein n=1 Tax=Shinella sp. TaxID=1870904 RepID=UPI0039E2E604